MISVQQNFKQMWTFRNLLLVDKYLKPLVRSMVKKLYMADRCKIGGDYLQKKRFLSMIVPVVTESALYLLPLSI
jgi:hypothetical protein